MTLSRRKLLSLSAAGVAGSLLPYKPLMAQTEIGTYTLTSLSDGSLTLPASMVLAPIPEGDKTGAIEAFGLGEALTPPCNVTLLQTGERNILFDVGAGSEFMSSAGFLLDALDEVGLSPEDITDIAFTHAHPDHIWGLVDDFDDLLFPDAKYMIGQAEWDYWTNPETVDTIDEGRTTFAVGAARRLARIADNITFFNDGEEILPGVAARATFGHTPGHIAFEVRQGSNAMMIIGDCIGNDHIALAHPTWKTGSDQDMEMGAATRTSLLDQIAHEQMSVLGFHLKGNGIGRIEAAGDGYRFIQDI
ncbi:MBL fold metallo-hydrolase [Octadecabacter ascidiaceicola]|uniref:Putative quorum-quenching lactonase YtnP n=1 Tax=Octadecabacter ascidiaceicola TaxID=1655543 RepID=A0A238JJX0_9RHOB|nr:MBL fold metallo-hydrolase [Octadecabacter ascidiaceicola]SMX30960.1 putative quorum-quenching lactonase YtnP [Octadecabacter ascidiaceicola]